MRGRLDLGIGDQVSATGMKASYERATTRREACCRPNMGLWLSVYSCEDTPL